MINSKEAKKIIDSVTKDEVGENIEREGFIVNKYYTNIYINNEETGDKQVRIDNIEGTIETRLDEFKEKFNKTIIYNPERLRKFDSESDLKVYFVNTASGTAAVSTATPYSGLVLPDDGIELYKPNQKINTINFSPKEDKSVNINIGEAHKPIKEGFWRSVLGKIAIGIIIGVATWFIIRLLA